MKWIWNNIVMDKFSRLVSKLDGWLWRKRWDNYTKRKNKWKELNMPYGKGTYGKKVGRPKKKKMTKKASKSKRKK